jgi:GNAT superfamily N-acetyltransferase
MDIYPEKEHWLGGVFVSSEYRGKKIASKIVIKLLSIAESLNVKSLYLQTENLNGGLYSLLGWQPLEQVNYHGVDVLVMEKRLSV